MRKLFLTLFIASTSFAGVDVSIDGAFGAKLGSHVQVSDSLIMRTREFDFAPLHQFSAFQRYYVKLTPKSRKVYAIGAEGYVEEDKLHEKMDMLRYELAKKYLVPSLRLDQNYSNIGKLNRLYVEEAVLTSGGSITLPYKVENTRGFMKEPHAYILAYSEGNKCVMEVVDVKLLKLSIKEEEELRKVQDGS